MKLDNKKSIYRIWLRRLLFAIIFTLFIILILLTPWFDNPGGQLTKYHLIIAIGAVYLVISIMNYLRDPHFVFFSDASEMIILRFYPVSIFNNKKHSIEIPKKQFVRFETKKFFFGLEEKLIVYQNFRGKAAKYPAISLSALNSGEKERIKTALRKYVK